MVSIVSSYPGFHALPRGIKQMLLTSERHFFLEAKPAAPAPRRGNGVTHLAPPPKFEPLALPPEIRRKSMPSKILPLKCRLSGSCRIRHHREPGHQPGSNTGD